MNFFIIQRHLCPYRRRFCEPSRSPPDRSFRWPTTIAAEIDEIRRRVPMRDQRPRLSPFRHERKNIQPRGVGSDDNIHRRQRIDLGVQCAFGIRPFQYRLDDQLRAFQRFRPVSRNRLTAAPIARASVQLSSTSPPHATSPAPVAIRPGARAKVSALVSVIRTACASPNACTSASACPIKSSAEHRDFHDYAPLG